MKNTYHIDEPVERKLWAVDPNEPERFPDDDEISEANDDDFDDDEEDDDAENDDDEATDDLDE